MSREVYYDFPHKYLLRSVLQSKSVFIDEAEKDAEGFRKGLSSLWETIPVKKDEEAIPSFNYELRSLDDLSKIIIISIPEAKERLETPYIGVVYDKASNIRYFTYEIGEDFDGRDLFFLCEWKNKDSHVNYQFYEEQDIDTFMRGISDVLVKDIF